MTEPGADQRAREEAAEMGEPDVTIDERPGWYQIWNVPGDATVASGTVAELWAAIHTMAAEWYLWGKDGDDVAERVAKRGTERVRVLLGMEPES